jgi:hypothetical protein
LETFEWEIVFRTIVSGSQFRWSGNLVEVENRRGESEYQVHREEIEEDGDVFLSKAEGKVLFEGKPTLKLKPNEGLISILKEEDRVRPLFEGFLRIFEASEETFDQSSYGELNLDKYADFNSLKDSQESLRYKLWWAYNNKGKTDAYDSISTQFIDIFPNFTSFSMSIFQFPPHGKEEVTNLLYTDLVERGTETTLDYDSLASGMQRTLDFLGQIHFLPNNSVILIDEFENGLGSNCIDLVADAIQNAGRGLQFMITSHHPYIINSIGFKHWKIVTRKGGVVSAHPASEFGLGRSRHENFSQLVQLEAFQTGMMPE